MEHRQTLPVAFYFSEQLLEYEEGYSSPAAVRIVLHRAAVCYGDKIK